MEWIVILVLVWLIVMFASKGLDEIDRIGRK